MNNLFVNWQFKRIGARTTPALLPITCYAGSVT